MTDMKKVFFLVHDLNAGGIENYLLRFLKHYEGHFLPTVICKGGSYGSLYDEYKTIKNIRIISFQIGFFNPNNFFNFKKFLQKEQPDTLVDFGGNFAGISILGAKLAGVRNRITFYRGATNRFKENFLYLTYNKFVNYLVFRYSSSILSNSQSAFDFFFGKKVDNRFEVIYNGINAKDFLNTDDDLRQELNIPKNAFVISNVGRFVESKNQKAVIEVASKLCKQNRDIYFVICGKDVTELTSVVQEKKIQEQVKLLDFRRDIIKVLNTSDAFYFPSYTEGQPNALIEALFVGLPFVASDIDPIKETIPQEFHYLLTKADDTEKASELLKKIYSDKEFREKINLSKWAIKNYDASTQFEKFYTKL